MFLILLFVSCRCPFHDFSRAFFNSSYVYRLPSQRISFVPLFKMAFEVEIEFCTANKCASPDLLPEKKGTSETYRERAVPQNEHNVVKPSLLSYPENFFFRSQKFLSTQYTRVYCTRSESFFYSKISNKRIYLYNLSFTNYQSFLSEVLFKKNPNYLGLVRGMTLRSCHIYNSQIQLR